MTNANDKPVKLEIALVNSVSCEKLFELKADVLEILFDSTVESGIFKDIPIFGSLLKLSTIGFNIRDQFFAKKIYNFLFEIKDIPQAKRLSFIRELEEKDDLKQTVGETLLILLEKLDHMEKPKILGRLLKAKMNGDIDLSKFMRLASVVDKVFLPDIYKLANYVDKMHYEENVNESLIYLGLIYDPNAGRGGMIVHGSRSPEVIKHTITNLGKDLLKYGIAEYNVYI